jgi:tryptophan 2,3-dioxygenase
LATNYSDYLKLPRLLALQDGVDGDERKLTGDELLFIVVHQADELWFKLILRELEQARDLFARDPVPETALAAGARGLRRAIRAFELATEQFALIETMTPRDFLDFRDKLLPASGFQSPQFREVEILLGLDDAQRLPFGSEKSFLDALAPRPGESDWARARVAARLRDRPSFRESLERWLARTPIDGSVPTTPGDDQAVARFVDAFLAAHEREVRVGLAAAKAQAQLPADVPLVEERYLAEIEAARAFLRVADPVRRRVRAATLFIESYRELPLLAWPREVLDLVVALEQAILVWRQRHARMVERMIGRRIGTGGSSGVDYLDATAQRYRVFPDMWSVRTLLLRKAAVPPLANERFYFEIGS